jgi:hypothetical protein
MAREAKLNGQTMTCDHAENGPSRADIPLDTRDGPVFLQVDRKRGSGVCNLTKHGVGAFSESLRQ